MCGRYVTPEEAALNREYHVDRTNSHIGVDEALETIFENYNVAPTLQVPVVRVIRDQAGVRESVAMRWGLIPYFAAGQPPKGSTINARVEHLETHATWRGPWQRGQRCVMPCAGFYEWQLQPDGKMKQPFYIRPVGDGTTFPLAAVWDRSFTPTGEEILSCAVITMDANELLREIHNTKFRMPAILQHEDIDTWLSGTPERARAVLKQYPSEQMWAWPVSKAVNAPKSNGPELIQSVEMNPEPGTSGNLFE